MTDGNICLVKLELQFWDKHVEQQYILSAPAAVLATRWASRTATAAGGAVVVSENDCRTLPHAVTFGYDAGVRDVPKVAVSMYGKS